MDNTTEDQTIAATVPTPPQYHDLEFRGNGIEYTKIVLVNIVLTILTFGIFSAWAKVRTRKYLYGNTYLNGFNFNYHADPLKILMGRLIVGSLLLVYIYGSKISIYLPLVAIIGFILLLPWMYVKSLSFNLSNTSYRNIRFGFKKDYKESYSVFIKGYILTLVTFGLCFPYFYQTLSEFRIENTRYGKTHFKPKFTVSDFFTIFLKIVGIYILSAIVMAAVVSIGAVMKQAAVLSAIFMGSGVIALYAGILFAVCIGKSHVANLILNQSQIQDVRFRSSQKATTLFIIYLQNILLGIVTLGLGVPYGLYRVISYKLKSTAVLASSVQFDQFFAQAETDTSGAIFDAADDFLDLDIGF